MSTEVSVAVGSQNGYNIASLYGEQAARIEKKLAKSFFPKDNDQRKTPIEELALMRLIYLASMNGSKNPFTENELKTLAASDKESFRAVWGLRIGGASSLITVLALSYIGLAQSEDSPIGFKLGLATVAASVNAALTGLSYWATGFAPHFSSNAFNDTQDMLLKMEETYEDLAYRLIELYYSPNQKVAIEIAQNIDMPNLEKCLTESIHKTERAKVIVQRLAEAQTFIKSNGITWPKNTRFKYFISDRKRELESTK